VLAFRFGKLEDGVMHFARPHAVAKPVLTPPTRELEAA
jgi:hypothetical protein